MNSTKKDDGKVREFTTGATRTSSDKKLCYHGFTSPLCDESFAKYMHEHRFLADGSVRAPDNWQQGIPLEVYIDSMYRHMHDLRGLHDGYKRYCPEDGHELDVEELCNAIRFNVEGYKLETLIKRDKNE